MQKNDGATGGDAGRPDGRGHRGEVYLDANATTRVLPAAAAAAKDVMETLFGNPSSSHITGLRARSILESVRGLARRALGAGSGRIVFTSGATEAIQLGVLSALCSWAEKHAGAGERPLMLYGATEHKAVPETLRHWNSVLRLGGDVLAIPVDRRGVLDLDFIRECAGRAAIICTMLVNNETGVIQDMPAVEAAIRGANEGCLWMVDSVQALAKVPLDFQRTTIDYAPLSGHKLYAPKGVGLLYVRPGAPVTPLIAGGGQESGARSGTENLPGVAAFGAVLEALLDDDDTTLRDPATLASFREALVESLTRAFPDIVFNADFDNTVATTLNFSVRGFASKEILDLFDAADIRVSSGSACGSGTTRSEVLDAMGAERWQSESAIRLSFGPATTRAEIEAACARIEEASRALRQSCLLLPGDVEVSGSRPQDGLIQLKRGHLCSWIFACAADRTCVIIDPLAELAERIEHFVNCQHSTVQAILDTHSHVDHTTCRPMLLQLLGAHATAEAKRCDELGWPLDLPQSVTLGDGSVSPCLRISGDRVLARNGLAGHTADSRGYYLGMPRNGSLEPGSVDFAFTGDAVLIGGIGRTDFSVSSASEFYDSLRRLDKIVGPDTIICPTHDYTSDFSTTLAAEKRHNELLRCVCDPDPLDREIFIDRKLTLDRQIDDRASEELICGVITRGDDAGSSIDVRPDELDRFFHEHEHSLFVDVREPHEYELFKDWESIGMRGTPANVPMTKFSQFLREFLASRDDAAEKEVIFICRSGTRSARAAQVLRRLGVSTAWHIAGGIALGGARARSRTSSS